MIRMLAPLAVLGLVASPALAATTKITTKHHAAKPAKKVKSTSPTTSTTK